MTGHSSYIWRIIKLHDEGFIASSSDDNSVIIWNWKTATLVRKIQEIKCFN